MPHINCGDYCTDHRRAFYPLGHGVRCPGHQGAVCRYAWVCGICLVLCMVQRGVFYYNRCVFWVIAETETLLGSSQVCSVAGFDNSECVVDKVTFSAGVKWRGFR